MKRIIICADGTWNKPESDPTKETATNVLKFSRGISPLDSKGIVQTVFYDWGIGSYHDNLSGGAFGKGLDKNIKDCYRFLVHNYENGDELFFFGFSRGAYTVRSLAGLINNCSILKKEYGELIESTFEKYKQKSFYPSSDAAKEFRAKYSVTDKVFIKFVGVWDTVGSLGLPTSIFGFIKKRNLFYDNKIGSIIKTARHAMGIDELRKDFEQTIWKQDSQNLVDLKQVWFSGSHSDIGGGYNPDKKGKLISDIPMMWMKEQAEMNDLQFKSHIYVKPDSLASTHNEYKSHYKLLGKHVRKIFENTPIHISVKERYEKDKNYRPDNLVKYVKKNGWVNIEK